MVKLIKYSMNMKALSLPINLKEKRKKKRKSGKQRQKRVARIIVNEVKYKGKSIK